MHTGKPTAQQILAAARQAGTGVAAFNFTDIWDLTAIVNVAQRRRVPVLASSYWAVAETLGLEVCQAMVDALNRRVDVPVILHLDHSSSVPLCIAAIDAGYPSVMIDGSMCPLDENIRMTREVVEYAHRRGVAVEGEIGKVLGRSVEADPGGSFLADVDEAVELVAHARVDSLAVGIGTAHGFYKDEPKIHFQRLEELAAAVNVPLVLHGGTGIPDADIRRAIRCGITKVNVGTIIHTTYLRSLREELIRAGDFPFTIDVMRNVLPAIESVLDDRLRVITGDDAATA
ncbi:MAG: class II fructose-bisphosphate aldolase [Pirellulaceae bacterium]|jgi:ketose-bisphosphate aldolase|nr:class II fructose-bisphosphate aldolase [Pirellulaceae bacterium]